MTTNMQSLKEKMAKIQAQIEAEEQREKLETATAKVRDSFTEAIRETIAKVEKATGESLKAVGLGVWVAYPVGSDDSTLTISALAVGTDGLPRSLKKTPASSNGNGNGTYEYVLADGRVFDTCEKAVNAVGVETRDKDGNLLDGKKFYVRWDRIPKELQEKITKSPKAETPEGETPEGETPAETPAEPVTA